MGHLLTEEAQNPTRVKELPLWEKVLQEPEPLLGARQLDPARDTLGSATSLSWTLSTEQTTPLLTRVPSLYFCGVNDVLLTGLALAFGQWRSSRGADGDRSLLVDLEGHGRQDITDDVELSRTAGWFTNIYPARLDLGPVGTEARELDGHLADEALKLVKEQLRTLPDNGIGYGLLRHLNPHTGADLAQLPQPQIAFNYLGRFSAPQAEDWGMAAENDALEGAGDQRMPLLHALGVNAITHDHADGPQLTITCTWSRELLTEGDVRELGDAWIAELNTLAEHADDPEAGGRTPSDMSLLELSQSEIDEFEDELDFVYGEDHL
ncbi:condensation domain-containing protein [Streptomyces sp. M10(2022)]